MTTYMVVTLTCPDRPGIVERVTDVISPFSANWEDSRLARLGGEFAAIVLISVPEVHAGACMTALRSMTDEQTTVLIKTTERPQPDAGSGHILYDLRLSGADHEGIVHKVAAYLASNGVNVEDMETEVVPAPTTATPLFHMTCQIKVPPESVVGELQGNLERIGDELGVDISLSPSEASDATGD